MKNLLLIFLLCCSNLSHAATDVFCGLMRNHVLYSELEVTNGFVVNMYDPDIVQAGIPSVFSFFTRIKPQNRLVDELQYANERYMHVVGVSGDLEEFFHIHPARISKGVWIVTNTFPKGGIYYTWSDVKRGDIGYTYAHPPIFVTGQGSTRPVRMHTNQFSFAEGTVSITHSVPLLARKTNWFVFSFVGRDHENIELDPYLGSSLHVTAIREDAVIYQHSHPLDPQDRVCYFILPEAGDYKLFIQFRPKEAQLGQDETRVASFWVRLNDGEVVQKHPDEAIEAEKRFKRVFFAKQVSLFILFFCIFCTVFSLLRMWYTRQR